MATKRHHAELVLPWPPSVNHTYIRGKHSYYLSEKSRHYRRMVCQEVERVGKSFGTSAITMKIDAYPPDRRRRDIDNILKNLFDALQHAKLFQDDSQIVRLEIEKLTPRKPGCIHLLITELH